MLKPNTYAAAAAKLPIDPALTHYEYQVFWEMVTQFWLRNNDGLAV
jgi:hypothetical protein